MSVAIPIIFSHRGKSFPGWFIAVILQARLANPRSRIFVLHDFPNPPAGRELGEDVHFVHVEGYRHSSAELERLFFNLSCNPGWFERYCIERWLILREFMERHDMEACVHLDTDVLLFADIEEVRGPFKDCDFTISGGANWGMTFINRRAVLNEFEALVLKTYSRRSPYFHQLLSVMNLYDPDKRVRDLSDMVLITLFVQEVAPLKGFTHLNTNHIFGGSTFCADIHAHIIGLECEFETEPSAPNDLVCRKTYWADGLPYSKLCNQDMVRMNCLHFQGTAKPLIVPTFLRFVEQWEKTTNRYPEHGPILQPAMVSSFPWT